MAWVTPLLVAEQSTLLIFADQAGQALALEPGEVLQPNPAETQSQARVVHAMPTIGSVRVALGQPWFLPALGFRAVSERENVPVNDFEIAVDDSVGSRLFEAVIPAPSSPRRLTVVLVGDGSEQAPFRAVVFDG